MKNELKTMTNFIIYFKYVLYFEQIVNLIKAAENKFIILFKVMNLRLTDILTKFSMLFYYETNKFYSVFHFELDLQSVFCKIVKLKNTF